MILPLVAELSTLTRVPKLEMAEREKAYGLMRRLREYGFTNPELFTLSHGRIGEPTIKRQTRGVVVRDTSEHDLVLEKLADFAEGGFEVSDLEEYKKDKELVNASGLTFQGCATLSKNLLVLGVDAGGLLNLSEVLKDKQLTGKSIRDNIDLNERLARKGISEKFQEEALRATEVYGDSVQVMRAVNGAGSIANLTLEYSKVKKELDQANLEKNNAKIEKGMLEAETANFRSHIDVAKLLVSKYGFDLASINELMTLASKHGSPPQAIGAVNVYNNIVELQAREKEAGHRLRATEANLVEKEATAKVTEERLARYNQLLGEVKANYAKSQRIQIASDLMTKPKAVEAPTDEVAKTMLAILMGARENIEYNRVNSAKLREKIGMRLDWLIKSLEEYNRG